MPFDVMHIMGFIVDDSLERLEDWLRERGFRVESIEEHYRAGIELTKRLNNGDLSEISETLWPIVRVGLQNGGVRCVEVDAYAYCRYHIIMQRPLPIRREQCLALTDGVEVFTYDYDPHFTLPDLVCFKCRASRDIVAFPRYDDWQSRYRRP